MLMIIVKGMNDDYDSDKTNSNLSQPLSRTSEFYEH